MSRKSLVLVVFTLPILGGLLVAPAAEPAATLPLLDKLAVTRGIVVLIGDKECRVARELARNSELTLYVQLADGRDVEAARRAVAAEGLLGTRICVEQGTPARIGLADDLADALATVGDPPGVGKAEVLRVLRPEGRAIVGQEQWVKPYPPGVDDWTHHYRRPDNNTQSRDVVARAPFLTQFVVEPRFGPAPQCAVASGGRLFMAFGHIAWHQREEPWLNTLVAINGYNGTMLWTRPLTQGIMVDRSTMIATPKTLYLADDKSCKLLDPATGKQLDEIIAPVELTGGTFWKWMALENGLLLALVGEAEQPDPDARWTSTNHGWPWDGISKGYNDRQYRWGFAKTLLALDPKTKAVVWKHQEPAMIDARSLCISSGRVFLGSFGNYLACLDVTNGKTVWRKTAENDPEVFSTIGRYRPGHGWIEGWKTTIYMKSTAKALYVVGPQIEGLTALSTDDGRVLWKNPAKNLQIVVRDDGLYTIGAQQSSGDTKKLDPLTGKVLATYQIQRRACTRATGSADGIFFRGHEGSGRLDIASGAVQWISPMRPSCHVGVVIAGGKFYWLPWTCDCDLQMHGAIATGSAGEFKFEQQASDKERLESLAGTDAAAVRAISNRPQVAEFRPSPLDWPTYQADNRRTAQTQAAVPDTVRLLWKSTCGAGVSPAKAAEAASPAPRDPRIANTASPTAPVAAGGLVFASGTDGMVRAWDAATGQVRWTAFTGGPVYYPPSIADGRALVGSADGWAYCFEAATGKLLWRFRAAPVERRISLYGALVSTWPVAGGVLAEQGVAYFAAGMHDFDGTHVYALDAATGRLRWQNNHSGNLDGVSHRGVTCQGDMLLDQGKLFVAGGNSVSPGVFDAATGKCLNTAPGGMGTSAPRGRELRLAGAQVQVSGQPLYASPAFPIYDGSVRWTEPIVTAKNAKVTYLSRKGPNGPAWFLVARSLTNDAELWSQPLPAEPIRWGVAVDAQGRTVATLRDGQVLCFGARE
jgi:outer membrane protein assembly factor BamB